MNRKASYLLLLCCIAAFSAYSFFGGSTKTVLDFSNDSLSIRYQEYNAEIPYANIESLELTQVSDFGSALDGGSNKSYRWGSWENELWGKYSQCTITSTDYCIVLSLSDGAHFIVSHESEKTTIELSEMIYGYLTSNGYDIELIEKSP